MKNRIQNYVYVKLNITPEIIYAPRLYIGIQLIILCSFFSTIFKNITLVYIGYKYIYIFNLSK